MGRCKITKCVTTFILLFIFPLMLSSADNFSKNVVTNYTPPQSVVVKSVKEEIHKQLVENVSNYIAMKFDQNKSMATLFVEHGLSNDIDICFMLAQAEIETCFGKYGIGKTKKSMFGVQTRYSTYDNCIMEYCKLLKKSYLINGKTEHHLMKNYVNRNGHRYASSLRYESDLTKKYIEICRTTNIDNLQKKYN